MQSLWADDNPTELSSAFHVPAGKVCVLHATGFADERVRTDAEQIVTEQAVCVHRIIAHEPEQGVYAPFDDPYLPCGWIYDWTIVGTKEDGAVLGEEEIYTCGSPWQLTKCRNIGIIGVPGDYRLKLNDETAIGVVQVYAELYNVADIPHQIAPLFFS